MPAPLIGTVAAKTADNVMAGAHRREASLQIAQSAFKNAGQVETARPHTSSGKGQLISGFFPEAPVAPALAKKADFGPLHAKAKAASFLPDSALRLYDLVLKADDANGHSKLINVDIFEVSALLGISVQQAEQARTGLANVGLIHHYDNHSGDAGWRPGA